ncbi:MAG: hypothetical protein ABJB98_04425 [Actinomycetota bacterium]
MSPQPQSKWLGGSPDRFLWPDPVTGPFLVRLHWAEVDGAARLLGVDFRSFEEGTRAEPPVPVRAARPTIDGDTSPVHPSITSGGDEVLWNVEVSEHRRSRAAVPEPFAKVTVDSFRGLSFRRIDEQRRAQLTRQDLLADWLRYFGHTAAAERVQDDADAHERRAPTRIRGLSDEHYQRVARVITEAKARGERQTLNAVIAEFSGTPKFPAVSRDMANHWRRQAQERGYLPPPQKRTRRSEGDSK